MKITLDLDEDQIIALLGKYGFNHPGLLEANVTKDSIKTLCERQLKENLDDAISWSEKAEGEWAIANANGWATAQVKRYKF